MAGYTPVCDHITLGRLLSKATGNVRQLVRSNGLTYETAVSQTVAALACSIAPALDAADQEYFELRLTRTFDGYDSVYNPVRE